MNKPDKITKRGLTFSLALIIAALLLALSGGCASPRAHMYIGQGLDLATTYYALEVDGGFVESNDALGDIKGVIIGKIVVIGVLETTAYFIPSKSDTIYKIGAVFGYGGGAWNTYQIGRY